VQVRGDGGDSGHRQVPLLGHVAQSLQEGKEEAPEAGVDVTQDAAARGHGGQLGHRVDHPWGYDGADATISTVWSSAASAMASTSAEKSARTGMRRDSTSK